MNSIKVKLIVGVLSLKLPLIGILVIGSQYAMGVVRTQVSDSYRNLTTLYMGQVDDELEKVDRYLNGLVATSTELLAIHQAANDDEYYTAKQSLNNLLNKDVVLYPVISAFFMYSHQKSDFLPVPRNQMSYKELLLIQNYTMQLIEDTPSQNGFYSNSWQVHNINGEYYIIHTLNAGDVYVGAWQKASDLMIPLNFIRFGNNRGSLFATESGEPMTNIELVKSDQSIRLQTTPKGYQLLGSTNKFLVVGEPSSKGKFSLVAVIPEDQILGNLPAFKRIASFAPLATLMIIPIGLYALRRIVLLPINQLLQAMKRIREGNLNARIDERPTSDEFQMVNQTFNSMMGQIQELTVNVYEEKLSKQREELQRLQLQRK